MKVLVTGAAGFIGFHLAMRLLDRGDEVLGLDNMNDYYDVALKEARLAQLEGRPGWRFTHLDLADRTGIECLFARERPQRVINLAAQAGVRYSIQNPYAYIESNLLGFANILEACRHNIVEHLIYASSSSVYGANKTSPFSVHHNVDHPVSLYAATKKSNELMAHTYSYLYGIPTTGLRFFTVYGPWGRPDMALFKFTEAILGDHPIEVYNYGKMWRDFTYINDIVEGIIRVADRVPQPNAQWDAEVADPGTSTAPYKIYNIGNNQPVELLKFIEVLENCLGKKAIKNLMPMQPGDVLTTYADITDLQQDTGFRPNTPIEVGLSRFVEWYLNWRSEKSIMRREVSSMSR